MPERAKRIAIVLLLAAALLAGCVSPAAPIEESTHDYTTPMPLSERERTDLTVWYSASGTSGEAFTRLASAFDEENDLVDLTLTYSGSSGDTAAAVNAALLAGNEPDVALMYAGPAFTGSRGDFTMDDLIRRDGFDADDIYPGIWDFCRYYTSEKVCAVPYGISTQLLYYNADLLQELGVDVQALPETWDDFYDLCLSLKERVPEGTAVFDAGEAGWLFKSMLRQSGCPVVTTDGESIEPVYDDENAVRAAEYWKSLADAGIMPVDEHEAAESRFLSGKQCFLAMSSNRISRFGDAGFAIGAAPMPHFGTPSLAIGGTVLVIFTQDPQKVEASWDLISYLLTAEHQADFALSTGYLPIRKSALSLPEVQEAMERDERYQIAFSQLPDTWSYIHFEQMGDMNLLIEEALSQMERGMAEPQEALGRAAQSLRDEIADDSL